MNCVKDKSNHNKTKRVKNMKKIGMTIILFCMLILNACGNSSSYRKQLVGTWYCEGSSSPAFVLYDNGTCEIAGEYGVGTWDVVNENKFILINYYGETESAMIEKISNDEFVISSEDKKSIFLKEPADEKIVAIDEKVNISEIENNNLDNYVIQSIVNPSSNANIPFTIEKDSKFWVVASSIEDIEERRMLNINLEGDVFSDIPYIGRYNISIIDDKYIWSETNSLLYDFTGNDITNSFCKENEEFIGVFQDTTGWTIWVAESVNTYNSYELIVKAKDFDCNIKAEWSLNELESRYEEANLTNEVRLLGGSWYKCGNMILNVSNNMEIWSQGVDFYGVDDRFMYLCYSETWVSMDDIVLYDINGIPQTSSFEILGDGWCWFDRYLGEGIILFENHNGWFVLNDEGIIPFDVNIFSRRGTAGDDISINAYHDGKAAVELKNEGGTEFTTLIDTKGEFLFEPIEGSLINTYYENMWKYKYSLYREDDETTYLFDDEGNLIEKNSELYVKEGDELEEYVVIENGKIAVYPVEYIGK